MTKHIHTFDKRIMDSGWWRIRCMCLDLQDFLNGDTSEKEFREYIKVDLEDLNKLVGDAK